jgi:hypothetical protein
MTERFLEQTEGKMENNYSKTQWSVILLLITPVILTGFLIHVWLQVTSKCEQHDQLYGEQSFLQANSDSASQEIPRLLGNSNVYHHVHKSLPLSPVLSQKNPIHTVFKIYFNIILPITIVSPM